MTINISDEMARVILSALNTDIAVHGVRSKGNPEDYQVSNEEAYEFFRELVNP